MTDFESQAQNLPPIEAPKKTAESYEDFDRVFTELKSEVLAAVDSGKNLPPDALEKFHRELGHISDLFNADTVYGVEAELCRRLIEAYQKGDMEALKNMPCAGSHTSEEQRKVYEEQIKTGLYGEGVTVDHLMNIPRVYLNTLTGGMDFNQRDNLKDLGTFGNENTGYHASSYFQNGNKRITDLISPIGSSITDKLDLLANFIEENDAK